MSTDSALIQVKLKQSKTKETKTKENKTRRPNVIERTEVETSREPGPFVPQVSNLEVRSHPKNWAAQRQKDQGGIGACIYAYTYICAHIYIHICIHLHLKIHAYTYMYIYIYVFICI